MKTKETSPILSVIVRGDDLVQIDLDYPGERVPRAAIVPLARIRRIVVAHGLLAQQPALVGSLAIALLTTSFVIVCFLLFRSIDSPYEPVSAAVVTAVVGAFMAYVWQLRGPFLRVDTDSDTRKFLLRGDVNATTVRALLEHATRDHAIEVRWATTALQASAP